jgi:hypothetical protein
MQIADGYGNPIRGGKRQYGEENLEKEGDEPIFGTWYFVLFPLLLLLSFSHSLLPLYFTFIAANKSSFLCT